MIRTLIIFLPLFTSVLWLVAHRVFFSRSDTNSQLFSLLLFVSLFLFYDCCYADVSAPYDLQAVSILIAQMSTPCLVPLIIIYLRKLKGKPTHHPLQMLWVIAPAALFTSAVLLFSLAGPLQIESALQNYYSFGRSALEAYRGSVVYLFFVSAFDVYRVINYTEIIWLIVYLIIYNRKEHFKVADLWNFFFNGGEVRVNQLQLFNISVIFFALVAKTPIIKDFINNHSWLMALFALVVSVFVFWFCVIAMFGPKRTLRFSEIRYGWRYNYGVENKEEVVAEMFDSLLEDAEDDALQHIREKVGNTPEFEEWRSAKNPAKPGIASLSDMIFSAVSTSYDEEKRLAALQKLMMEEQLFLQPRITLGDVAERLDSNTTYVSRLVNNAYNLGFPEFINTLRVDYAEQYILNHREAKQEEIATKCGFLSASSFNNTFKRITGMTPKVWLASVDRITRENEARIL